MERNVDYDKIRLAAHRRNQVKKTVIYTLLAVWAIMVLFPFYFMILTSVKTYSS